MKVNLSMLPILVWILPRSEVLRPVSARDMFKGMRAKFKVTSGVHWTEVVLRPSSFPVI